MFYLLNVFDNKSAEKKTNHVELHDEH